MRPQLQHRLSVPCLYKWHLQFLSQAFCFHMLLTTNVWIPRAASLIFCCVFLAWGEEVRKEGTSFQEELVFFLALRLNPITTVLSIIISCLPRDFPSLNRFLRLEVTALLYYLLLLEGVFTALGRLWTAATWDLGKGPKTVSVRRWAVTWHLQRLLVRNVLAISAAVEWNGVWPLFSGQIHVTDRNMLAHEQYLDRFGFHAISIDLLLHRNELKSKFH